MKFFAVLPLLYILKLTSSYESYRLQNQFLPEPKTIQRNLEAHPRHRVPLSDSSKILAAPYNRHASEYPKAPIKRQDKLIWQQKPSKKISHNFFKKNHDENLKKSIVNQRQHRKISSISKPKFQLYAKKNIETKDKTIEVSDDNIAIESKQIETRVKPDTKQITKVEKKTYNAPASPKFIIKQAGPSQTYGWLGHGRYAPLNIPNIFKNIGLDTYWNHEDNSVFPVGLNYPPPKTQSYKIPVPVKHVAKPPPLQTYKEPTPVKEAPKYTKTTTTTVSPTTKTANYYIPEIKEAPIPVYKPSSNIYKDSYKSKPSNNYNTLELETLYYKKPSTTKPNYRVTTTYSTTTLSTTTPTTTTKTYYTTKSTRVPIQLNYASPKYVKPTTTISTYKSTSPPKYSPIYQSTPQTYFNSPQFQYGISSSPYSSPTPYVNTPSPVPSYSSPSPYQTSPSPFYGGISTSPPKPITSYSATSAFSQPIKPFTSFG